MTYSKDDQLARSPGGNRICPHGNLRSDCNEWSCRNSRNRKSGLKAQRRDGKELARALGKPTGLLNNEETTTWGVRWEAKSGKQAESVRRFYASCLAQADAATPIGSRYPFAAIADGLMVIKLSDFKDLMNKAKLGLL